MYMPPVYTDYIYIYMALLYLLSWPVYFFQRSCINFNNNYLAPSTIYFGNLYVYSPLLITTKFISLYLSLPYNLFIILYHKQIFNVGWRTFKVCTGTDGNIPGLGACTCISSALNIAAADMKFLGLNSAIMQIRPKRKNTPIRREKPGKTYSRIFDNIFEWENFVEIIHKHVTRFRLMIFRDSTLRMTLSIMVKSSSFFASGSNKRI